jgi:serine/threonine protein kinase
LNSHIDFFANYSTDFGLAKELKKKHLDGTFKLTGNTGSRRYMAPEVAKEQHYGLPVDGEYSL